jgi:hypothetical protein
VLRFESAYARAYRIQVSDDGTTWRTVASVPETRTFDSRWLNVDGRAGFVVRGSANPIRVDPTSVALSAGPAAGAQGMVVEARPAEDPGETAAAAGRPAPSGGPDALRASLAGGFLSLFNLGSSPIDAAALHLPQAGEALRLYRGVQRTEDGGTVYDASLAGADARVEAPRFVLRARLAGDALPALQMTVGDSRALEVENLGDRDVAQLVVTSVATGESREATVPAGRTQAVAFGGALTPSADLARARTTFPTSPLPPGMTDPDLAVDGDPATAWRPAGGGRMVVDLGSARALGAVTLRWTAGDAPAATVSVSGDGLGYRTVGASDGHGPRATLAVDATARYVAVQVDGWQDGDPRLADLGVWADAATAAGEAGP